jgi:hypothetical protein
LGRLGSRKELDHLIGHIEEKFVVVEERQWYDHGALLGRTITASPKGVSRGGPSSGRSHRLGVGLVVSGDI